ncbi:hypothetical protein ADUPG1_010338 [Aduncisulcus paluster]|uniref:Adhesin domain-containing protein n=1 Tax=Aduncisulcus paluster TaxID=2918883 RepID=A0ABQ5JRQ2_9EUKA|nr:hypothetical protein ADUPG1_010338 [Aduncisulcus paluster]
MKKNYSDMDAISSGESQCLLFGDYEALNGKEYSDEHPSSISDDIHHTAYQHLKKEKLERWLFAFIIFAIVVGLISLSTVVTYFICSNPHFKEHIEYNYEMYNDDGTSAFSDVIISLPKGQIDISSNSENISYEVKPQVSMHYYRSDETKKTVSVVIEYSALKKSTFDRIAPIVEPIYNQDGFTTGVMIVDQESYSAMTKPVSRCDLICTGYLSDNSDECQCDSMIDSYGDPTPPPLPPTPDYNIKGVCIQLNVSIIFPAELELSLFTSIYEGDIVITGVDSYFTSLTTQLTNGNIELVNISASKCDLALGTGSAYINGFIVDEGIESSVQNGSLTLQRVGGSIIVEANSGTITAMLGEDLYSGTFDLECLDSSRCQVNLVDWSTTDEVYIFENTEERVRGRVGNSGHMVCRMRNSTQGSLNLNLYDDM